MGSKYRDNAMRCLFSFWYIPSGWFHTAVWLKGRSCTKHEVMARSWCDIKKLAGRDGSNVFGYSAMPINIKK
jgi:hypothetical protein